MPLKYQFTHTLDPDFQALNQAWDKELRAAAPDPDGTYASPDFSRMAVARKSRSFPQRDLAEEEARSLAELSEHR
jgi:hypothetical protein